MRPGLDLHWFKQHFLSFLLAPQISKLSEFRCRRRLQDWSLPSWSSYNYRPKNLPVSWWACCFYKGYGSSCPFAYQSELWWHCRELRATNWSFGILQVVFQLRLLHSRVHCRPSRPSSTFQLLPVCQLYSSIPQWWWRRRGSVNWHHSSWWRPVLWLVDLWALGYIFRLGFWPPTLRDLLRRLLASTLGLLWWGGMIVRS